MVPFISCEHYLPIRLNWSCLSDHFQVSSVQFLCLSDVSHLSFPLSSSTSSFSNSPQTLPCSKKICPHLLSCTWMSETELCSWQPCIWENFPLLPLCFSRVVILLSPCLWNITTESRNWRKQSISMDKPRQASLMAFSRTTNSSHSSLFICFWFFCWWSLSVECISTFSTFPLSLTCPSFSPCCVMTLESCFFVLSKDQWLCNGSCWQSKKNSIACQSLFFIFLCPLFSSIALLYSESKGEVISGNIIGALDGSIISWERPCDDRWQNMNHNGKEGRTAAKVALI